MDKTFVGRSRRIEIAVGDTKVSFLVCKFGKDPIKFKGTVVSIDHKNGKVTFKTARCGEHTVYFDHITSKGIRN